MMEVYETRTGLILKAGNQRTPTEALRLFTDPQLLADIIKRTDMNFSEASQKDVEDAIGGNDPKLHVEGTPMWTWQTKREPSTALGQRFLAIIHDRQHNPYTPEQEQTVRDHEGGLVDDILPFLSDHSFQSVRAHLSMSGYIIRDGRYFKKPGKVRRGRTCWSKRDKRLLEESLAKHDMAYTLSLFPLKEPSAVKSMVIRMGYSASERNFGGEVSRHGKRFTKRDRERLLKAASRHEDVTGLFPGFSRTSIASQAAKLGVSLYGGFAMFRKPVPTKDEVATFLERYAADREGRQASILVVFPDGSVYSHGRETEQ